MSSAMTTVCAPLGLFSTKAHKCFAAATTCCRSHPIWRCWNEAFAPARTETLKRNRYKINSVCRWHEGATCADQSTDLIKTLFTCVKPDFYYTGNVCTGSATVVVSQSPYYYRRIVSRTLDALYSTATTTNFQRNTVKLQTSSSKRDHLWCHIYVIHLCGQKKLRSSLCRISSVRGRGTQTSRNTWMPFQAPLTPEPRAFN